MLKLYLVQYEILEDRRMSFLQIAKNEEEASQLVKKYIEKAIGNIGKVHFLDPIEYSSAEYNGETYNIVISK